MQPAPSHPSGTSARDFCTEMLGRVESAALCAKFVNYARALTLLREPSQIFNFSLEILPCKVTEEWEIWYVMLTPGKQTLAVIEEAEKLQPDMRDIVLFVLTKPPALAKAAKEGLE